MSEDGTAGTSAGFLSAIWVKGGQRAPIDGAAAAELVAGGAIAVGAVVGWEPESEA